MNKIFKNVWNKTRNTYVAVSEVSGSQTGHACLEGILIGSLIIVPQAAFSALGPSLDAAPTPTVYITDKSKLTDQTNIWTDYLRKDQTNTYTGVIAFHPGESTIDGKLTPHSPYYYSASFYASDAVGEGAHLKLNGTFLLNIANSRLYAVYSTENKAPKTGQITADNIIVNASNAFLIPTQAYSPTKSTGIITVNENLDLRKGMIIAVNGQEAGDGTLDVKGKIYAGAGTQIKVLHLTQSSGERHTGAQSGIIRAGVLDLNAKLDARDYSEEGFTSTATVFVRDTAYLNKSSSVLTGQQVNIGLDETIGSITIGKNLVLRGTSITAGKGVNLYDGNLIVTRNADATNKIDGDFSHSFGGKIYIGLSSIPNELSSLDGLAVGDVNFEVTGSVSLRGGGAMEVNTRKTDLIIFHRDISLGQNYTLTNNGSFKIGGNLNLSGHSTLNISQNSNPQEPNSIDLTGSLTSVGSAQIINSGNLSIGKGGSIDADARLTNKGELLLKDSSFVVSGTFTSNSGSLIKVGQSSGSKASIEFKKDIAADGGMAVYGAASFDKTFSTNGEVDIYNGGSVAVAGSSFNASKKVTVNSGGRLNLNNTNAGKFFTPGSYENISFDVLSGSVSSAKTNSAFAEWKGSVLSGDETLGNLDVKSGAKVVVTGVSGLSTRQAFELMNVWGTNSNLASGTLELLGYTNTIDEIKDRLTVKVANNIGKNTFLSHALDARAQNQSVKNSAGTAIVDSIGSAAMVTVGSSSGNLQTGYGFIGVEHATGLTIASGSDITLFGKKADAGADYYLVQGNSNDAKTTTVNGGTLILGLSTLNDSVGNYGKGSEYAGKLGTVALSSSGKVNVKDGTYTIENISGSGDISALGSTITNSSGGKNSNLFINRASISSGKLTVGQNSKVTLGAASASNGLNNVEVQSGGELYVSKGTWNVAKLTLGGASSLINIGEGTKEGVLVNVLSTDSTTASTKTDIRSNSSLVLGTAGANSALTMAGEVSVQNKGNIHVKQQSTVLNLAAKSGSVIDVDKVLTISNLTDKSGVTINIKDDTVLVSNNAWFENSTFNISRGYINAENIKTNNDLGANTYVVGDGNSSNPIIDTDKIGANPHPSWQPKWDTDYDKNYPAYVKAERITRKTTVQLNVGGLLSAANINASAANGSGTITMNCGVLYTGLDQLFARDQFTYRETIKFDPSSAALTAADTKFLGIDSVGGVVAGITDFIQGDSGTFVFNDKLLTKDGAASVVNASSTNFGINNVVFTGRVEGNFNIDDTNAFLTATNNKDVIFASTDLYSEHDDGRRVDTLTIGKGASSAADIKVGTGIGFMTVRNASNLQVIEGAKFALIGTELDGSAPGENGHGSHPLFTEANNLLAQSGSEGKLQVSGTGSALRIGNETTPGNRAGWAQNASVDNSGSILVRKGEYALWHIQNDSELTGTNAAGLNVGSDAYLHVNSLKGDGTWLNNGVMYLESDGTDYDVGGTFTNKGLVDGSLAGTQLIKISGTFNNSSAPSGLEGANVILQNAEISGVFNNGTSSGTQTASAQILRGVISGSFNNYTTLNDGSDDGKSNDSEIQVTGDLINNTNASLASKSLKINASEDGTGFGQLNNKSQEALFESIEIGSGKDKVAILNTGKIQTQSLKSGATVDNQSNVIVSGADPAVDALVVSEKGSFSNSKTGSTLLVEGATSVEERGSLINVGTATLKDAAVAGSLTNSGTISLETTNVSGEFTNQGKGKASLGSADISGEFTNTSTVSGTEAVKFADGSVTKVSGTFTQNGSKVSGDSLILSAENGASGLYTNSAGKESAWNSVLLNETDNPDSKGVINNSGVFGTDTLKGSGTFNNLSGSLNIQGEDEYALDLNNGGLLDIQTGTVTGGSSRLEYGAKIDNKGTLTLTDVTISGSSGPDYSSSLENSKKATIDSVEVKEGGLLVNKTTGSSISSTAGLSVNGDASFENGTFTNTSGKAEILGLLKQDGQSSLTVNGGIVRAQSVELAGVSEIASGATLDYGVKGEDPESNTQSKILSGSLTNNGTINADGTTEILSGTVANEGTINADGVLLVRSGDVSNSGTLNATGTTVLGQEGSGEPNLEVTNKGRFNINGEFTVEEGVVLNSFKEEAETTSPVIDLKNGSVFTNRGNLVADSITNAGSGNKVTFNQEGGSLWVKNNWINNSTVNLKAGVLTVRSDRDHKTVPLLGKNEYFVSGVNNIEPNGTESGYSKFALDWKDGKTVLEAESIDAKDGTKVTVLSGGVFAVDRITFSTGSTAKPFITLDGGALETTLGQLFVGEGEAGAIGIDKEKPSTGTGVQGGYSSLKAGVDKGISVADSSSWFVFTDESLMASNAASAVELLGQLNGGANVGFTGTISGSFNVSQANRFQDSLIGDQPRDYNVVFTGTVLANEVDGVDSQNKSLHIVDKNNFSGEVAGSSNYMKLDTKGFGFQAISGADSVTLETSTDGNPREFVLLGYNKGGDSVVLSDQDGSKALLQNAENGGTFVVESGNTLGLGSDFYKNGSKNLSTAGWLGRAEVNEGADLVTRYGEYAIFDLNNSGTVTVNENSVLHNRGLDNQGHIENRGTLLFENLPEGESVGSQSFKVSGTLTNKNVLDAAKAAKTEDGATGLIISGTLTNEKDAAYADVSVEEGGKLINRGAENGQSLLISADYNEGTSNYLNEGKDSTASWHEVEVRSGILTNKSALNLTSVGEEDAIEAGKLSVTGSEALVQNEGSIALGSGLIEVLDGLFDNKAEVGESAEQQASLIVSGSGQYLNETNSKSYFDEVNISGVPQSDGASLENKASAQFFANSLTVGSKTDNTGSLINSGSLSVKDPSAVYGTMTLNAGSDSGFGELTVGGTLTNHAKDSGVTDKSTLIENLKLIEGGSVNNYGDLNAQDGNIAGVFNNGSEGAKDANFNFDAAALEVSGELNNYGNVNAQNAEVSVTGSAKVNNYNGKIESKSLNTAESSELDNYAQVTADSVSLSGAQAINREDAEIYTKELTMGAGTLENSGLVSAEGAFNQTSGEITNSGEISVGADFGQTQGEINNTGDISVKGNLSQTAGTITNSKRISVDGNLEQTEGVIANTSEVTVGGSLTQNVGEITNSGEISIAGSITQNDGDITNTGNMHASEGSFVQEQGRLTNTEGGTFTVGSIESASSITNNGRGASGNQSVIDVNGVVDLKAGSTLDNAAWLKAQSILAAGSVDNKEDGVISFADNFTIKSGSSGLNGAEVISNAGIINQKEGTEGTFALESGVTLTSTGEIGVGTLNLAQNSSVANQGKLSASKFSFADGALLETSGNDTTLGSGSIAGLTETSDGAKLSIGANSSVLIGSDSGSVTGGASSVVSGASAATSVLNVGQGASFDSASTINSLTLNLGESAKVTSEGSVSDVIVNLANGSSLTVAGDTKINSITGAAGSELHVRLDQGIDPETSSKQRDFQIAAGGNQLEGASVYLEGTAHGLNLTAENFGGDFGTNNTYYLLADKDKPIPTAEGNAPQTLNKLVEAQLRNQGYTHLELNQVDLDNSFVVQKGGYLDVGSITFDDSTDGKIRVEGGMLRTSSDQIYDFVNQIQVGEVSQNFASSVEFGAGSYLIIDDSNYTYQSAKSMVDRVAEISAYAPNTKVVFIGEREAITRFPVSEARNLAAGSEVVRGEATLYDDQPNGDKYKEGGYSKVIIGDRTPDHDYQISANLVVKDLEDIHIIEVNDNKEFGLMGYVTANSESVGADKTGRMFLDCEQGGLVRVNEGSFTLGEVGTVYLTDKENTSMKGWIGKAQVNEKGSFSVMSGDYLVKDMNNIGNLTVDVGSVLRVENYNDASSGNAEGELQGKGNLLNKGLFVYAGNQSSFDIAGTFENRGDTFFNDTVKEINVREGAELRDISGINFSGSINTLNTSGKVYTEANHQGATLTVGTGSEGGGSYEVGGNAAVSWTDVSNDGAIKVAQGSSFSVNEGGTFRGNGSLINAGTANVSTDNAATAGSIVNSGKLFISNLSLTGANGSSVNTGEILGSNAEAESLTVGNSHKLENGPTGRISVKALNMGQDAELINYEKGTISIVVAQDDLSGFKSIQNAGEFNASNIQHIAVGSDDGSHTSEFVTYANSTTNVKDVTVNPGSSLTSYGVVHGADLNIAGEAIYTVGSGARDDWSNIDLTGTIHVENNGRLVVRDGGKLLVHSGYEVLIDNGGTLNALLEKENATVEGTLTNNGTSEFKNLDIAPGATSVNNNAQKGSTLYVATGASHSTGEQSRSEWDEVQAYSKLTNGGHFIVHNNITAGADIENNGRFMAGGVNIETAHRLINNNYAEFGDVTIGSAYEAFDPKTNLEAASMLSAENAAALDESGDQPVASFENNSIANGANLKIDAGGSYVGSKGAQGNWDSVKVIEDGRFEVSSNFATGRFTLGEQSLTRSIANPLAHLKGGNFVAAEADLSKGDLYVGDGSDRMSATLEKVLTPVGAYVRVLPSGDLGFGASAISDADAKGAVAPSASVARVSVSTPVTFSTGGMYVGTSGETASPATGLFNTNRAAEDAPKGLVFDKGSALVLNLADIGSGQENAALRTSEPDRQLEVEPSADLYLNLSGAHKGNYYITSGFSTDENVENGQWVGGWDGANMIAIPQESVARWKLSFHYDTMNTWIEAKLTEIPDVAAIEVATEILDNDTVDYGPGGDFIQEVLNRDTDDIEKAKRTYNSMVNLAFTGGQLATAYSSMVTAVNAVEARTSMTAEGFNSKGWVANKQRSGDLWVETLGRIEKVDRYDASKIDRAGFESKSYGVIVGADHLFAEQNVLAGVAFSYQDGNVKSRDPVSCTKNEFETYGVKAYGYWSPNPYINVAVDAGYYRNSADINQTIPEVAGFNKASAKAKTNMASVGLRLESTLKAGEISVIPHVGVRYNYTKTGKYDTKLDGKAAFSNKAEATNTVQFPLGVTFRGDISTKSGWKVRPTFDASAVLQAGDTKQQIRFSTLGDEVNSTIYGRFTGPYAFVGSLGIQAEKKDATIGLRYGITRGARGKLDQQLKIEAVWRF